MNKKLMGKIGLDAVMTALLAMLMIYTLTGAYRHEILGLGIRFGQKAEGGQAIAFSRDVGQRLLIP